jgi:arylsulfatase A-like enzyme
VVSGSDSRQPPVEQPLLPGDGRNLSSELLANASESIQDARMIAPNRPFFVYTCPGGAHATEHRLAQAQALPSKKRCIVDDGFTAS